MGEYRRQRRAEFHQPACAGEAVDGTVVPCQLWCATARLIVVAPQVCDGSHVVLCLAAPAGAPRWCDCQCGKQSAQEELKETPEVDVYDLAVVVDWDGPQETRGSLTLA